MKAVWFREIQLGLMIMKSPDRESVSLKAIRATSTSKKTKSTRNTTSNLVAMTIKNSLFPST